MKILVETAPDVQAALVLDDYQTNSQADTYAAQEAIKRVLNGKESRIIFNDEELADMRVLNQDLYEGRHDTRGGDITRVIRGSQADLLLDAMRLYVRMPEAERAELTDTGEFRLDHAAAALADMTHVFLKPNADEKEIIREIAPQGAEKVAVEPHVGPEYAWLYDSTHTHAVPTATLGSQRPLYKSEIVVEEPTYGLNDTQEYIWPEIPEDLVLDGIINQPDGYEIPAYAMTKLAGEANPYQWPNVPIRDVPSFDDELNQVAEIPSQQAA